jgi:hypothetical protein
MANKSIHFHGKNLLFIRNCNSHKFAKCIANSARNGLQNIKTTCGFDDVNKSLSMFASLKRFPGKLRKDKDEAPSSPKAADNRAPNKIIANNPSKLTPVTYFGFI